MKETKLKRKRQAAGMSQRELADRSGVNYRTLQDYEQGKKLINRAAAGTVQSIADALDCTVWELLE